MNILMVLVFFHFLLEMGVCDDKPSKSRVIQGYEATSGQFPWAVLMYCDDDKLAVRCTGSLIREDFVLTAAHCLIGKIKCNATMGIHDLRSPSTAQHIVTTKLHPHSCFENGNPVRHRYDIGLAELQEKVKMVDGISFIRLPDKTFTIDVNSEFTAVGWGLVNPVNESELLRYVIMKQAPQEECMKINLVFEDPFLVCAKSVERKMQICSGDSGGPTVYGSGKDAVQIAVNSFTPALVNACESPEIPQGFLLVTPLLDWIHGVMEHKSDVGVNNNCEEHNFSVVPGAATILGSSLLISCLCARFVAVVY